MIKLIGLHGKKQSGKDTSYELLSKRLDLPVARDAFADRLKISFARLFLFEGDQSSEDANYTGWTDEECIAFANHFKERGQLIVPEFKGGDMPDGVPLSTWSIGGINGREALQRYGTECHRNVFGTDFWIEAVIPDPSDKLKFGRKDDKPWSLLIVTDVRFPNEADAIHDAGGVVWHVVRPDLEDDGDTHASEIPLDPEYIDATIVNDGTLDDLSNKLFDAWQNVHVPTTYAGV